NRSLLPLRKDTEIVGAAERGTNVRRGALKMGIA
ncbi:hypothetical protein NPIL_673881, partial [Nephila pilipes]